MADFQFSGIELVEMQWLKNFVWTGIKILGANFNTFELIPEIPGDDWGKEVTNLITLGTLTGLKENPSLEVLINLFFLDLLNRVFMKFSHSSFLANETDSIDVNNC